MNTSSRSQLLVVGVAMALALGACAEGTKSDSANSRSESNTVQSGIVSRSDLTGKWTLTKYEVKGAGLRLPSAAIFVSFDSQGRVSGDDGTNTLSGAYKLQGKTLVVDDVTSTAAAPPASGPLRNSATAIAAVFYPQSGNEGPSASDIQMSGTTLIVKQGTALLQFSHR